MVTDERDRREGAVGWRHSTGTGKRPAPADDRARPIRRAELEVGVVETCADLFPHNVDDARIGWGDPLRNPLHFENDCLVKFEVGGVNPLFSLDR